MKRTELKKAIYLSLVIFVSLIFYIYAVHATENYVCNSDSDCDDWNLYTYDSCLNPGTAGSYCNYQNIRCLSDNDCGFNGFFGDEYCSYGNVFKMFLTAECINPGRTDSSCEMRNESKEIVDCGTDYCDDYGESYCKMDNMYHSRNCYKKSCEDAICISDISFEEKIVQTCDSGCSEGFCNGISCRTEGETIPVVPNAPQCCSGLALIPPKQKNIVGIMGICTAKCGNGVCDSDTETEYNCADDCGNGNNQIACSTDSDCGLRDCDNYGNYYCKSSDVYMKRTCYNPSCENSVCIIEKETEEKLYRSCLNGCNNGECRGSGSTRNRISNEEDYEIEDYLTADKNSLYITLADISDSNSNTNSNANANEIEMKVENKVIPNMKNYNIYMYAGLIIVLVMILILLFILALVSRI